MLLKGKDEKKLSLSLIVFCSFISLHSSFHVCYLSQSHSIAKRRNDNSQWILHSQSIPTPVIGESNILNEDHDIEIEDAFSTLAGLATTCLLECERKRDAVGQNANSQPSSATNWIDEKSSFVLKQAFDKIQIKVPEDNENLIERDETQNWLRWMKSSPCPSWIELSPEFRAAANTTTFQLQNQAFLVSSSSILNRIGFRMLLLPSGAELQYPIKTPTGSISYGTLLYGGVTRFRLLSNSNGRTKLVRRAAERTEIMRENENDQESFCWVQYGGPDRKYEGVDMGPAAVLELWIQPRGTEVKALHGQQNDMVLTRPFWDPKRMFSFRETNGSNITDTTEENKTDTRIRNSILDAIASGNELRDVFDFHFKSSLGGLQPQIRAIIRRVLDGRIIQPNNLSTSDTFMEMEARELSSLGLTPVRGLLLYGPPGCGKTALAREIAKILCSDNALQLSSNTVKIISAPELLDRWVGGSERLVRELFADAEEELQKANGDATKSNLHVVIIDEIDAVFRKRTTSQDSGETTRNSAVNQILAKLDGINAIPNLLLIGMTNRKELLDDALLRPGRLEVQMEIPLPDEAGRREILQLKFDSLRNKGKLSQPLCWAIDGTDQYHNQNESTTKLRKRDQIKNMMNLFRKNEFDLASDCVTGGYSGADLEGLVRAAGSLALARARNDGGGLENLLITLKDVKTAILEYKK